MKRNRRKNGSLWCRLFHRAHWYGATRITKRGQQRTQECRKCKAWYARGALMKIDAAVQGVQPDPNAEV